MKSVELAGAIGLILGKSQGDVWHGELMRSVGAGLAPESRRSRWTPDGIFPSTRQWRETICTRGYSVTSREWPRVSRDHSRSRHGNQRP